MYYPKKRYVIMSLILIGVFIPMFGHSNVFIIISRIFMLTGLAMAFFDKEYRERLLIHFPDWSYHFLFFAILVITIYQLTHGFAGKISGQIFIGSLTFIIILMTLFFVFKRLIELYPEKRKLLKPLLSIIFLVMSILMFEFVFNLFLSN